MSMTPEQHAQKKAYMQAYHKEWYERVGRERARQRRLVNGPQKRTYGAKEREYRKQYYTTNRETIRAKEKVRRQADRLAHPERYQAYARNFFYGLSQEQFAAMVTAQGGACALCRRVPSKLVVDHDHTTDRVRALLCTKCNVGLGHFNDDVGLLGDAIAYLRRGMQ